MIRPFEIPLKQDDSQLQMCTPACRELGLMAWERNKVKSGKPGAENMRHNEPRTALQARARFPSLDISETPLNGSDF